MKFDIPRSDNALTLCCAV